MAKGNGFASIDAPQEWFVQVENAQQVDNDMAADRMPQQVQAAIRNKILLALQQGRSAFRPTTGEFRKLGQAMLAAHGKWVMVKFGETGRLSVTKITNNSN